MTQPVLFDRLLLGRRRARAARSGEDGAAAFLLDRVAADFGDRLAPVLREFPLALDLGTPTPALRLALRDSGKVGRLVAAVPRGAPQPADGATIVADEEALPFADGAFNLIAAALNLHLVNDLPGALVQIRRALRPDGLFLAALLGGETLTELRQSFAAAEIEIEGGLSPRVASFVELRDAGALMQRAGFALPVVDLDRIVVRYPHALALLTDLRAMGATNMLAERRRTPLKRAVLMRMAEIYAERFADADGRLRATFDVVWLSGWAPHASQQQPLRPGSARARLADALNTREYPAGEKPGG